jgi:hypothetical protein
MPVKAKATLEEKVLERLDLIIKLLALQSAADKSVTERAYLLKLAGMDTKTIAEIFDTSNATIRVLTSRGRRRK